MIIYDAAMLTKSDLFVNTDCGPLFLDEEDFEKFKFNPYWVVDFYDTKEVLQLMIEIKQYYINEAINMIERGEIKYEDII